MSVSHSKKLSCGGRGEGEKDETWEEGTIMWGLPRGWEEL